ncbi:MAG: hypothetical protein ACE5EC_07615, partial [Phycisphaerae bacterium]
MGHLASQEDPLHNANSAAEPVSLTDRSASIPLITHARIWIVRAFLVGWIRCFSLSGLYKLGQCFGFLEYLTDYKRRRRVHGKLLGLFKNELDDRDRQL